MSRYNLALSRSFLICGLPAPLDEALARSILAWLAICDCSILVTGGVPQGGIAATKMGVFQARRAKENSPGREPWVRIANWRAPERGERNIRLQLFRPVPGLPSSSPLSQCPHTRRDP